MDYIKVKELFKITKGKKVEEIDYKNENSIRYIQIDDLRNNNNIKHCENINKYVIAKKEDIIIAWDGANAGTIGFGIEGAIGSTLAILRKEDKEMDTEFCGLFLRSKSTYLREKCTGATIPHIQRTALEDIKIPKVSLNKQVEIKNIINKSQELIDKRKEQIKALDELVKSQFIKMFGDPAFNTKNWKVVELGYLLREKASNGFFAKNDEYKINGNSKVMWLGDIINRRYSNIYELKSVDVTEVQLNKYRVQYGDLLFCRSSLNKEGIGKASAVPKNVDNNIMFECHIIRIPLDLSKCVPEFIQVQSTLHYFRNQIISNAKTATMTTISQDGIVTTKLILPDLELQRKFVETVYQIDKLKFEMENSLKELEDNFNSLMQRAFKGELIK